MPAALDRQAIVALLKEAGEPLKAREIARALGCTPEGVRTLRRLLRDLVADGEVGRLRGGRYRLPGGARLLEGRFRQAGRGAAFILPDSGREEVFVGRHATGTALHGDRVTVELLRRGGGRSPEGRVVRVLERARTRLVGLYTEGRGGARVVPDDRKILKEIRVPSGRIAGAQEGQKVVVEITDWGAGRGTLEGRVVEILGDAEAPGVDVLAIARARGIDIDFPPEVEEEAERAAAESPLAWAAGRWDLRELPLVTIDPEDAKDHDDAVSLRPLGEAAWEIGVHIADVAHYVAEGSAIDREALRRGTSIYLVDRTIPMLPPVLSSEMASLNPGEDRLALSVLLTVDDQARVQKYALGESLIRSRHRMTYEEVQEILEGVSAARRRSRDVAAPLAQLRGLTQHLTARRMRRGSLDFDLPESRVILGPDGLPLDIQKVVRLESHRLIEELMLLANETVARHLTRAGLPVIYRVHDRPDPQKMEDLRLFVAEFGLHLAVKDGEVSPRDLQRLLREVEGRPEEALVSTVVLRSLKRAAYSTTNIGHFGLAASIYTHFTSPIRRYPDLTVHRLVRGVLRGERLGVAERAALRERLTEVARLASEREEIAEEAERDSVEMKKVEFMERHIGEVFPGTITGILPVGFFVELEPFHVEGLVHVRGLGDDYYQLVEEGHYLRGRRRGRRFRLGDRVIVKVVRVDKTRREIDFRLVREATSA